MEAKRDTVALCTLYFAFAFRILHVAFCGCVLSFVFGIRGVVKGVGSGDRF